MISKKLVKEVRISSYNLQTEEQCDRHLQRYNIQSTERSILQSSSSTSYFSEGENDSIPSTPIIPPSTSYSGNNLQSTSLPTQTNIISAQNQNALASSSPIVARYDYAPFGKITKAIGQANLSPLRFSSEVFDPETALTYFNYRYYNPTDGRWISRDPAGESASINLYSFVNNAPTYLNDYLGLEEGITLAFIGADFTSNMALFVDEHMDVDEWRKITNADEFFNLGKSCVKN